MKRITSRIVQSLAAILVVSGALAINLQAQSDSAVTVNIPFPFTVARQNMAPGTYQFSLVSSQFMLSVLNVNTGDKQLFPVRPEQQKTQEIHGRLIFRNTVDRHVLNEIHFPGADLFSEMIPQHRAQNIEASKSSPTDTVSVARR